MTRYYRRLGGIPNGALLARAGLRKVFDICGKFSSFSGKFRFCHLHKRGLWQTAERDEEMTEHAAQVWMVGGQVNADQGRAQHADLSLAALGDWTGLLYDFHWCIGVPKALRLYSEHQQDARQYTFQGLVGGTDGSANERTSCMGAGFNKLRYLS